MRTIARGGSVWLRVLAPALASALACSGGGGGSTGGTGPWSPPVRELSRLVAPPVTPSLPNSEGGASTGALTCPDLDQVVCGSVCCPSGTVCVGGECRVPVDVQGCPAEAPVVCDATVSCASGCTAFDESGRGNHLTVAAPAGFGEGRAGGAVYMNRIAYGLPEQLVTGPGADLVMDRATVEVWIRPGQYLDPGDWQAIYVHGGRVLYVKPQGIQFGGCTVELGSLRLDGTGDPLGEGMGWHFIAVTVDGTALRFYLDSRPAGSCDWAGTPAFPDTWGQVQVGTNTHATASFSKYQFQGAIDELRILDVARSEAEIQQDYELARLPVIAGTRALWRFDEGARRRCCPEGTSCTGDGHCAAAGSDRACPSSHPIECEGGFCCASGTSCGDGACELAGTAQVCGPACGEGKCCPQGYQCIGSEQCIVATPYQPTIPSCPADYATVGAADGKIRCCPQRGYPIWYSTSGVCNGCQSPVIAPGQCYDGYAWCATEGKCIAAAAPPEGIECAPGTTYCPDDPADSYGGAGCCADAGVCREGSPVCCPASCGDGPCVACPTGGCCTAEQCAAGRCWVYSAPVCGTDVPCGSGCCPAGAVCGEGDVCVEAAAPWVSCTGDVCGDTCCAEGMTCVSPGVCAHTTEPPPACPPDRPVACAGGVGCCPASYVCPSWSGDVCRYAGTPTPTSGPTGPTCSDTTACAAGQICTATGCCPGDHPLACGTQCCLPGGTCVDGACACPDGRAACSGMCCGSGTSCVNGACTADCADPQFPLTCGEYCCSPNHPCVSGDCPCRGDHPVECGDACCLAGATCGVAGCGCPESAPLACGDRCCAPGQQCLQCPGQSQPSCRDTPCPLNCPSGSHQQGSSCVCDTPGHYLNTCPGGSKKCCLSGMACCYSVMGGPADCTPTAWCQ